MRKSVKRALGLGIVSGAAYAAWRAWNAQMPDRPRGVEWETAPFPFPPVPRSTTTLVDSHSASPPVGSAAVSEDGAPWVEPEDDGTCPPTHPIKAKLSSGIYHVPGGANYNRTHPDRCYVDEAAAAADGLRPSKA